MNVSASVLRKLLFCSLFLSCLSVFSFAQNKTVSGTIRDKVTGKPLPDVTVNVKGTNQTTVTNEQGKFSLSVPSEKSVLVITHVGYGSQEVTADRQQIAVNLASAATSFEEVVVIGYGAVKKRDLT